MITASTQETKRFLFFGSSTATLSVYGDNLLLTIHNNFVFRLRNHQRYRKGMASIYHDIDTKKAGSAYRSRSPSHHRDRTKSRSPASSRKRKRSTSREHRQDEVTAMPLIASYSRTSLFGPPSAFCGKKRFWETPFSRQRSSDRSRGLCEDSHSRRYQPS